MTRKELITEIKATNPRLHAESFSGVKKQDLEKRLKEEQKAAEEHRGIMLRRAAVDTINTARMSYPEEEEVMGTGYPTMRAAAWMIANSMTSFQRLATDARRVRHQFEHWKKIKAALGTVVETGYGPYTITEEDVEQAWTRLDDSVEGLRIPDLCIHTCGVGGAAHEGMKLYQKQQAAKK